MSTSKNLDRLFTENFKEFEPEPPADSWANIQQKIALDNQKINLAKNTSTFYTKLFYLTASCCFVSITAGIANYIYYSNNPTVIQHENVYNDSNRFDYFNDYEKINKIDFYNELQKQTELLDLQINNRKPITYLNLNQTETNKELIKPEIIKTDSIDKIEDKEEVIATEIADVLHVQSENMIVDETVGNTINERDSKKIKEAVQVAEGTIVVTSNGNRVLRINSASKNIDSRLYSTKIDSTSLSADELKLINQNKKKLKYKN